MVIVTLNIVVGAKIVIIVRTKDKICERNKQGGNMKYLVRITTTVSSENVLMSGEELLELSDKIYAISVGDECNEDYYFSTVDHEMYGTGLNDETSYKVIEEYEED